MRTLLRLAGWICVAMLLVVLLGGVYVHRRGGSYPTYAAASFATLSPINAQVDSSAELLVRTEAGTLRGAPAGAAIAYKGIPYARPPVGDRRWQAPQPAEAWAGVRDATRFGAACVQRVSGLTPFFAPMAKAYGSKFEQAPVQSSEDCLFLNVWSPPSRPQHPLPVMVWLHGGSNIVGSGTQSTYDGASLASHGVVLVTINYRLGTLGFFSHPELTAESTHHSSGNYALLDQLAALGWVRRNIAQFGGDPENVTLFGESAGAIDAGALMSSPLSAGLFRRVISESGPPFGNSQSLAQAEAFGKVVGDLAQGDARLTPLQRLRALAPSDVDTLVARAKLRLGVDGVPITTDGWVLPRSVRSEFAAGSIPKVELLVGLNGREFSAFRLSAPPGGTPSAQKAGQDSSMLTKLAAAARPYYGAWTTPAMAFELGRVLLHRTAGSDQAANDLLGAAPIGAMANLASASGQRVFVYRFDRAVPGKGEAELGAFHSLEVPYVFGTLQDQEWKWLPSNRDDEALSNLLQTYWTNFAKTGNPNASGLPIWPVWSDEHKEFLVVERDGRVSAQRNFQPLFSRLSVEDLKKRLRSE